MRSKNYQLMLLTGALTVSFAANAVEVRITKKQHVLN